MINYSLTKYVLMFLMILAALIALNLHPTHKIADEGVQINLNTMIPKKFGDWKEAQEPVAQVINPQQKETIEKIYSQTLSRNYLDNKGNLIMLSIAYGVDQSDEKQLHYPEVCYPAQGFHIDSIKLNHIHTKYGDIRVKQLLATMDNRSEPITYWTTVGNKVVMSGIETKLEQLRYGFKGKIPDGLLFRVSTITADEEGAYKLEQNFIDELIFNLSKTDRLKISGLQTLIK